VYARFLQVVLVFSLYKCCYFFKNVFVQGFKRKEKEEVPAAQESMEKSAGKEEVERSLNEEPKGVKEIAFVYGSKIDKENNEDKKPLVPHHFVNLLMSGDLYL